MDLLILDRNFQLLGSIDIYSSLIWNRRYYEVGDFELHTGPDNFKLLRTGSYIYRPDVAETAIIELPYYSMDAQGGKEVLAKGRFLEQVLDDRVIDKTHNLKGTPEEVIRAFVDAFAIHPADSSRVINKLRLGAMFGLGDAIEMQVTGTSLLTKIQEIALSHQMSIRVFYDYLADEMIFTVWQGKDRTERQSVNSWATFSTEYENQLSVEFMDSIMEYKNYAYVAGEGEGSARIIVEIDAIQEGEDRRELYVDARDLQREQEGKTLTIAEYREVLRQRGLEKLAEYKRQTSLEGAIDVNTNLIYRKDFDLGDICTYVDHDLGIEIEQRITEITEVYEGSKIEISAAFGEQQLNVLQKIKRGG